MPSKSNVVTLHSRFAGSILEPTSTQSGGNGNGAGRPHQMAIGVNDLTWQEREELSALLEAELARD